MWKKLLNTEYYLSIKKELEVCITNYVSIWYLHFSQASFLACLQESNFGLEVDEKQLVQRGMKMLTNPENLKNVRVSEENSELVVQMSISFGFPLKLKIRLREGSKELFFSRITVPLLRTVRDLHSSQKELRDLLQKKDKEIEEYKCEGGEIALRFLKTIPFNDEAHNSKYPAYSDNFSMASDLECLLNKTVDVPETHQVKEEIPPILNVKEESSTPNRMNTEAKLETPAKIKTENVVVKEESPRVTKTEDVKSESMTQTSPVPNKRLRKKLNL